MNKPVIALDLDDTLFEHFKTLKSWYNKSYGTNLTLEDNHPYSKKHWGTPKLQQATLKRWNANSAEEAILRVQKFFSTEEFRNAEPYPDSQTTLKKLSEKFAVIVVTARDVHLEQLTRGWITHNFRNSIYDVRLTARYNLRGKAKSKIEILKLLEANYVIDDNAEVCREAADDGILALLFGDYPWNQLEKLPDGVTRVKDWQEVLSYFNERS